MYVNTSAYADMHGIQLRRIKGNHWEYKRVVDDVIRKAKL